MLLRKKYAAKMMKLTLAAVAAVALAHEWIECPEGDPMSPEVARCLSERAEQFHREPKWVKEFSVAANGPEQIWINYYDSPDSMAVRYISADPNSKPGVQWGVKSGSYPNVVKGSTNQYTYGKYTSGLIHTTILRGLPLGTTIYYRVGDSATGYSQEYSFTSNRGVGQIYPYTVSHLADVGESDAANDTITHILSSDSLPNIDSVMIHGDIAYASGCESSGCTVWDAWGRLAQPLAAIKPWGINLGNHELYDTANGITAISAKYRYAGMPAGNRSDGPMYFSWESGPVHFISFCSFFPGGFSSSSALMQWMQKDLASIDKSKTPWIVVSQHAPWYNSNKEHQGDGEPARQALEQMFIAAGVSILFNGHVHAYERSFPVNNNKVVPNGPGSITHLNIGDGGASLYTSWISPIPAWSAVHSASWGHGQWTIFNNTHSLWTWHENDKDEKIISDSIVIPNSNAAAWTL